MLKICFVFLKSEPHYASKSYAYNKPFFKSQLSIIFYTFSTDFQKSNYGIKLYKINQEEIKHSMDSTKVTYSRNRSWCMLGNAKAWIQMNYRL